MISLVGCGAYRKAASKAPLPRHLKPSPRRFGGAVPAHRERKMSEGIIVAENLVGTKAQLTGGQLGLVYDHLRRGCYRDDLRGKVGTVRAIYQSPQFQDSGPSLTCLLSMDSTGEFVSILVQDLAPAE